MDQVKLNDIVNQKNEELEWEARRTAGYLLDEIVAEKAKIVEYQRKQEDDTKKSIERIAELQQDLRNLTYQSFKSSELLGE